MLMRLFPGATGGSVSRALAGFGSGYGPQPYFDTLHRGYGWGRIIDEDVCLMPLISAFRSGAEQLTERAKEADQSNIQSLGIKEGTMSVRTGRKEHLSADAWDEVLLGDKGLFAEMTKPFLPALLDAARQQVKREKVRGNLPDTVRPEELVAETLVEAWLRRYSRWNHDSLKEWLLSIQRWALHLLVQREMDWEKSKAVSLEDAVKSRRGDDEYDEWDWVTPQSKVRDRWRDVIGDENSLSYSV